MSATAEKKLWDYLDEKGVPFRETRGTLVSRYGYERLSLFMICAMRDSKPFMRGMTTPIHEIRTTKDHKNTWPEKLSIDIDPKPDAQANYAFAVEQVTGLFGPGEELYHDDRTIEKCWNMGWASISARGYLTTKRTVGRGLRDTVCTVTVAPAWRLPLSDVERRWAESYNICHEYEKGSGVPDELPFFDYMMGSFDVTTHDYPLEMVLPRNGYGVSGDQKAFIRFINREGRAPLVRVVPVSWIDSVRVTKPFYTPEIRNVTVKYRLLGDKTTNEKLLLNYKEAPDFADDIARSLADKLGVDLEFYDEPPPEEYQ